jgi:hypothetical protein
MQQLLAIMAVLSVVLAACGDSDEPRAQSPASEAAPTITPPESAGYNIEGGGPECSEFFVDGAIMTEEVAESCVDLANGTIAFVASFVTECADGRLFIHNPRGYGIVGETLHVTPANLDEPDVNSPEYQGVQMECGA